jgi:hypothetical protein
VDRAPRADVGAGQKDPNSSPPCTGALACDGAGSCLGEKGQACNGPGDCASGFCVDGTCCESACTDTCKTCANATGTCTNVGAGLPDPSATVPCTSGHVCDGLGVCKKDRGQPCAQGSDCALGFCVDNTCCENACTDTCKSCGNPTGTCSYIPAGQQDSFPVSACSGTYACDGSGNCLRDKGQSCSLDSQCALGHCVDSTCCADACTTPCKSCANAFGTCTTDIAKYTQDAPGCTGSNTCDGAGHCLKANGQGCTGGADCSSGFCVDGVCCDAACDTACKSCNVAGSVGTCSNLPRYAVDTVPADLCTAPSSCDGAGHCKKNNGQSCPGGAGDCASGFCVDTVCCDTGCDTACMACNVAGSVGTCSNLPRYASDNVPVGACTGNNSCDGAGMCRRSNGQTCPNGTTDCASGNCADGVCCDTACTAACKACNLSGVVGTCANLPQFTTDNFPTGVCTAPNTCDGLGNCKRVNGQACPNGASDCASGYCVDGVCCESTCTGTCLACNVAGHEGTCWSLPLYAADNYPNGACVAPSSCDGAGHCKASNGQPCPGGASDCASGNCVDTVCCNNTCDTVCKSCNVAGSVGTCTNVPQNQTDGYPANACVSGNACDGAGTCKKAYGVACGSDAECASGHCVDGVCCDTGCLGTCMACNVATHVGTCWNLPQFSTDGTATVACLAPSSCDGAGHCKKNNGELCPGGAGDCTSGNCVDGVCCDTACQGTCMACNVAAHVGTCWNLPQFASDNNPGGACVAPMSCDGAGHCKNNNGQACPGGNGDCASGYCVDGVCCSSSSCGACQACNVSGSAGTCANLPQWATDDNPAGTCIAPKSCDGAGHCKQDNGQACPGGTADCVSGNCVDTVCCDTACMGTCMACNVATHVGTCWNLPQYSTDTVATTTCVAPSSCDGAGHCKKQNGESCPGGSGDCASGNCVDGVCCNSTCQTACMACNVAGSVGTCANLPRNATDDSPPGACTGTSACDGSGNCKKNYGGSCSSGGECASGYCADNTCCDTTCTDTCKACNVAGHAGTCFNLPQYSLDPNATTPCLAPNSCDGTGLCKGSGGQTCTAGSQCASTFCVDGVCCASASCGVCQACNVGGHEGSCWNLPQYSPDNNPSGTCTGTQTCDGAGHCLKVNGQTCAAPADCASGNCVDNVCCDSPCMGTCKACNVAPNVGVCSNLPQFTQDSNATTTCTGTSTCDGNGNCKYINGQGCGTNPALCASGFCMDGVCCESACTAACMACNLTPAGSCLPLGQYTQDNNPTNACTGSSSCDGAGHCRGVNGQTCTTGADCSSGYCVDNVCCNTSCQGTCMACNVAGSVGTCANLPVGNHDNYPLNTCVGTQACDGAGQCLADYGQSCTVGTQCASGFCVDNRCCNSACMGTCMACNVGGHEGTCYNLPQLSQDANATTPCTGNNACDGTGLCKLADGQACGTNNSLCASGLCVDGVCCDSACQGTCMACNVATHVGTCWNVPQYSQDPSATSPCTGTSTCDGAGRCKASNGQTCATGADCASGNCVDNVCCDTACQGSCMACNVATHVGTCWNLPQYTQDNYPVGTCIGSNACDGSGHCKYGNGAACGTDGTLCASGNCVDGVCCGASACGACQSCNLGTPGTCTNIGQGQPDNNPAGTCIGTNACDGAGHCKASNGQTCATGADCASGNCVDGVCCDTPCQGSCMACNVATHVGTCWNLPQYSQDSYPANICVGNNQCDGAGHCLLANGQTCSSGGQCASGNCIDGVCCNSACGTACYQCNLATSVGTCAAIPKYGTDSYPVNACVGANQCDGAGTCKLANGQACGTNNGACASGYCVDGVCCESACNGTCKTCNGTSPGTCTNVAQNATDPGTCTSPNSCDGAGTCKKGYGVACGASSECASSYCVDGTCCHDGCTGQCKSCANSAGTCTSNVAAGTPDTNSAPTCADPNACDGNGGCCGDTNPSDKTCGGVAISVDDNQTTPVTVTGNIPVYGDEAWVQITPVNTRWSGIWSAAHGMYYNPFDLKIWLSNTNGGEFQMEVYATCAYGSTYCGGLQDVWEMHAPNQCYGTGNKWVGYNDCINFASYLGGVVYVRITRVGAATWTCGSFTLSVTNNW